jgi:molecular chaperone DnaJ
MNVREAYKVLGLSEQSSEDEVKKKYKELSKKYHPDVNKESDAEDKFKKINEAYQRIKSGDEPQPQVNIRSSGFNPFGFDFISDMFNRNSSSRSYSADNILLSATISFTDSVLGVKKNLEFSRKTKCRDCNGQGKIKLNNGCDKCKGRGQVVTQRASMMFVQTCDKCYGKSSLQECSPCSGEGVLDTDVSITVSIPGGVSDGNILRLAGIGNFSGQFMNSDQFTDVHLCVNVEADPDLYLDGADVLSTLDISLLEALTGCTKKVKTVLGNKDIYIKPASKHNEFITIPNAGVNKKGCQKVMLNVAYPNNLDNIINLLQKEGN